MTVEARLVDLGRLEVSPDPPNWEIRDPEPDFGPDLAMVNPELMQAVVPRELWEELKQGLGELGNGYGTYLKKELGPIDTGQMGEVPIPEALLDPKLKEIYIVTWALIMGFGHHRPQEEMKWLLKLLGFNFRQVLLGDRERHLNPVAEGLLRAAIDLYMEQSVSTAKANKMYRGPDYQARRSPERYLLLAAINLSLRAQGKQATPAEIAKIFAGLVEADDPESLKRTYAVAQKLLGILGEEVVINESKPWHKILRQLVECLVFKQKLALKLHGDKAQAFLAYHPLLALVAAALREGNPDRVSGMLMCTDRTAQPAVHSGLNKALPIATPMSQGRTEAMSFWGLSAEEANEVFPVLDGFGAVPMAAFARDRLACSRQEALAAGEPVTYVLTASQVAVAQEAAFQDFIDSIKGAIEAGEARVLVQCGSGKAGKLLLASMQAYLKNLPVEISQKIGLHWSESATGAVDWLTAVLWSKKPVVVVVKASEVPNMMQDAGVPCILTGCVGVVEVENVRLLGMMPNSVVVIPRRVVEMAKSNLKERLVRARAEYICRLEKLPLKRWEARIKKVTEIIAKDPTLEALVQKTMGHLDAVSVPDDQVLQQARELIAHPPKAAVNRQAMLWTVMLALGLPLPKRQVVN